MNFSFQINKAVEAASEFIQRSGGSINIMKLVKLIYLLDRLSLDQRGFPVVGGSYFSMTNGPVTSEILDLINYGRLRDVPSTIWEKSISDRINHEIKLVDHFPPRESLSDAEIKLIDQIWSVHGPKNQWELVEWCHSNCKEWTRLQKGCLSIGVENIAEALGKSPEAKKKLITEASELNMLDELFEHAS